MRIIDKLLVVMALVVIATFPVPAMAQEIEHGVGLICDTKEQIERFVALNSGDPRQAVANVNEEAKDEKACAVAPIAYVRGPQVATARGTEGTYNVFVILVVGVVTQMGVQPVPPMQQFTLFKVNEQGA